METQEDFADNWLPTLDTSLQVDSDNRVLYKFFEKPTSSNMTVQRRTAMGEDAKVQVISNDIVRRLKNNSEVLGSRSKREVVDPYYMNLVSSGYSMEQVKMVVLNGIKGYEGKRRRAMGQGGSFTTLLGRAWEIGI